MKRVSLTLAIILFFSCASLPAQALSDDCVAAKSAIVISGDTGEVVFEKNADERMLIASTTKVMTALVAIENSAADEMVTIAPESVLIEGSSMYLKPGESYTVEELICGLMLVSGNDAAHAIAMYVGGSIEGFAELMNQKAAELGLQNTAFENPHGLDAEGHYSTARDLAIIMREAMGYERFREISGARSATVKGITYYNHNKLLGSCEGINGGKTGYTMAAGRSLISSCLRGGTSFIIVTLDDPDDWADHRALYEWAFGEYEYQTIVPRGEYTRIPVISGSSEDVGAAPVRSLGALVPCGASVTVRDELPRFVFANVRSGERAGLVSAYLGEEQLGVIPLCFTQDVPIAEGAKLSLWEQFNRGWELANKYGYYFWPAA